MLKTSMSDYEKLSAVTYPFYFINRQSIHKTNCMQRIKKILMREVFPAIALKAGSFVGTKAGLSHDVFFFLLCTCYEMNDFLR